MKRACKQSLQVALALALSACAGHDKPRPVEVRTQRVEVAVRAPCPEPVEYERLKKARPVPLRESPMPDGAAERVAKAVAQLLRYEGEGGWADQVTAALDRCQEVR